MAYRILIVDDSAVVRAVLKKTIGMIELPVEYVLEAGNGKEALETIKQNPIDVVLADINMPEMNGVEMAAALLKDAQGCDVPAIVVITTERNDVRIQSLRDSGIKGYVHKPFTPEQIREVLHDVLGVNA